MNARDVPYPELLQGNKQFIIPIFQRDYSWGAKHCLQLWEDIIRIGSDPNVKGHFIGSIVYIAAEETTASITRWLLIDGQQRITSLTLLLIALRNCLEQLHDDQDDLPRAGEIEDYYLINPHGKEDLRTKLSLRRMDHKSLLALIFDTDEPTNVSSAIKENFKFFAEKMNAEDLRVVYNGVKKLMVVQVHLNRGQDDPQMIFESLNSTGVDLLQADLIRNFVLMKQEEKRQASLFEDFWQPIEDAFGSRYSSDFDKFVRDYLTIKLQPSQPIKADAIYQCFQEFYRKELDESEVEQILDELKRFAKYYLAFAMDHEVHDGLCKRFSRLRSLVVVVAPVLLRLYDCYERLQTLSVEEFMETVELLESFVFRRSVCGMQTRNLGQIFSSLSSRIKETEPLTSLKIALARRGKNRRFPEDAEFMEVLMTRDIYEMRQRHYLLDRLENDSKENIETSEFTVEHILPQNPELHPDWREMLGEDWREIQRIWLHRLGNLTLTGYNSEYSDRPFEEKKTIKGGFNDSPLRLNKFVREQDKWTAVEIEKRGKQLARQAIKVWPALVVDMRDVQAAELEERITQAAKYSIDSLKISDCTRGLFDVLCPQVRALGNDVVELFGSHSVTFRIYDFFLEIIPRRWKLDLLLNLDFKECDDPEGVAQDTTQRAYVMHAAESGGVLCEIHSEDEIKPAMYLIRQAYDDLAD